MIGPGSPINVFGALPSISIENDKVMEGITFSIRKRFTIAASGVLNIIFDPTAFVGKALVTLPITFDATRGPVLVDIYNGATANDDGTLITPFNRNFVSGNTVTSIFRVAPTGIDTTGIDPIEYVIPSDGVGVANSSGAGNGEPLVSNIDWAHKALLRLTNSNTTAATVVGIKFDFFEVV